MKTLLKKFPKITGVLKKKLNINKPFEKYVSCFAETKGTVILLSGGGIDSAKYNIAAIEPLLELTGKGNAITLKTKIDETTCNGSPLEALRFIMKQFMLENPHEFDVPVSAGLFGYLSYDLKDNIEKLPKTTIDETNLPDLYFVLPKAIIVEDIVNRSSSIYVLKYSGVSAEDTAYEFIKKIESAATINEAFSGGLKGFKSNFKKENYIKSLETIIDYIKAGDIYQANMSQKFTTDFQGSAYGLFKHLFKKNPAPFFAFINAGDHFILSTSPERFILQKGDTVETRPIKGTRPRGKTKKEDEKLKEELFASYKDAAELSMIVDLMRNDISRVCKGGSVKVVEHKKIEAYQNVYHLVSVIKGELLPDTDSVDLIKATFPGGSITGCPKIRSMEIIDEQETFKRHIYTGSIGYISFHKTMDLSIAIRTATIHKDTLVFSVGGGIVYDSDPEDEYNETLHKGKTLLEAFTGSEKSPETEPYVWKNGGFIPESEAQISINTPGCQYGFGIFETIKAENGSVLFLYDHIQRFQKSWDTFFNCPFPDLSWRIILTDLIKKNGLSIDTAVIKIMAFADNYEKTSFSLIMTAKKYVHRLKAIKSNGIRLITFPSPRFSVLSGHKTTNYMYYDIAKEYAIKKNGDEALILNPDNSVSETNTANILFRKDKKLVVPVSAHSLPGIMLKNVICTAKSMGFEVTHKIINTYDMETFDNIILSNSLMGCVPVLSVDNFMFKPANALCRALNIEIMKSEGI